VRTLLALLIAACTSEQAGAVDRSGFANAQRVEIRGYDDHAMEPFLTRDGRYLVFNNSNAPDAQTDLHWAERVDDETFEYRGRLAGANSSALDGVPTVDREGNFFFVTLRSYEQNLTTIYRGRFDRGVVSNVAAVSGISRNIRGQLNFDVEVSADGATLYFVDGLFTGGPVPAAADLAIATGNGSGGFERSASAVFAAINTNALEYAAAISENELELFFTRIVDGIPQIYGSTRPSLSSPWSSPYRIEAIVGFTEAPTLSPNGSAIYYHALRDNRFVIERVTRMLTGRRRAVKR
jgi:hypothetical protein